MRQNKGAGRQLRVSWCPACAAHECELCQPHAQVSSSAGRQYGKDKMFDGCPDTCWHSKDGRPQSITLEFDRGRAVEALRIQFQGGFAATQCQVLTRDGADEAGAGTQPGEGGSHGDCDGTGGAGRPGDSKLKVAMTVYPQNNNEVQEFALPPGTRANVLKLECVDSADMFGRIVVYLFDVLGAD